MCRINPKVDLVFKKLFGSEENKDLLKSLVNSIMQPEIFRSFQRRDRDTIGILSGVGRKTFFPTLRNCFHYRKQLVPPLETQIF